MQKLTKAQQREMLRMKFGGYCAYCGNELNNGFHVDHVDAIYRDKAEPTGMQKPENDVPENLFPACKPCNLFKSVLTLEAFRQEILMQAERAERYSINHRTARRFGQIEHKPGPVVFWFEKYLAGTANENKCSE